MANSELFKLKARITRRTAVASNTKDVEITSILTWSVNSVITNSTVTVTFIKADTKLYLSVVTLSIKDNTVLLKQLKLGIKKIINWNKSLVSTCPVFGLPV